MPCDRPRIALTTRSCECFPRTRSPSRGGSGFLTPARATSSSTMLRACVIYSGWRYVLVQAGSREARTWRTDEGRWFTALPELMFRRITAGSYRISGMTRGHVLEDRPI